MFKRVKNPSQWYNNIKWENISNEKTQLAYDNAISFLNDIEQSQKNLDNKALVFLSYLFTISGVLLYHLLFKKNFLSDITLSNDTNLAECILFLCSFYSIIFCLAAMIFLSTQRRLNQYANPKDIFLNSHSESQHLKNDLCIGLQESINFNVKKQNRRASFLRCLLLLSVIIPIATVIYSLLVVKITTIVFVAIFSYLLLWFLFRFYP